GAPFIRFYAAARLAVEGHTLGTLCVYDTRPKQVSATQTETLRVLGRAGMECLARRLPARSVH
ncbi:MAG: histidine kinase, partial [Polaromonas sp.]|nr:histidine kinase [Polaromonas sp.]